MLTSLNPDAKSELAKKAVKAAKDGWISNVKIIPIMLRTNALPTFCFAA